VIQSTSEDLRNHGGELTEAVMKNLNFGKSKNRQKYPENIL